MTDGVGDIALVLTDAPRDRLHDGDAESHGEPRKLYLCGN
jgi:hypothetical protein